MNHPQGTILPAWLLGFVKRQVELQIQILYAAGGVFGDSFVEQCCVEQPLQDGTLLSGIGVRTKYWTGTSPGLQGCLAMATSITGLSRALQMDEPCELSLLVLQKYSTSLTVLFELTWPTPLQVLSWPLYDRSIRLEWTGRLLEFMIHIVQKHRSFTDVYVNSKFQS